MDYKEEKISLSGDGHVAIHDWAPVDKDGHHKDSNEIEHDINETRNTMDILFDTLTDRLHPRTMIDRLLDRYQIPENRKKTQDAFLNAGRRLSESFQENPVPLVLIGLGAAWLLLERRAPNAPAAERPVSDIQEKAEGVVGKTSQAAREKFANAKERLSSGFEQAKESIKSGSEKVRNTLSSNRERATESINQGIGSGRQTAQDIRQRLSERKGYYQSAGNSVNDLIRDKPLAVGIAAAMIGMAAGILFPESKAEHQAVGAQAKEAFEKVKEREEDFAERGKQAANETVSTAYQKADEKGVIPESFKKSEEKPVEQTTKTFAAEKREVQKPIEESNVSPDLGKISTNLKEDADKKIDKKERPDKPLA